MQNSLQKEYNALIKEVSKDVMELSVYKSIKDSSNNLKEQVPKLSNNINELMNSISSLNIFEDNLGRRDNRISTQLKEISKVLDKNLNETHAVHNDLAKLKNQVLNKLIELEEENKKLISNEIEKVDQRLIDVNENLERLGNKSQRLLVWTLSITSASFAILSIFLVYLLLQLF